jgi:hypothetical protein
MVRHREREIGPSHLTSGDAEAFERLRARHLVDEVAIDIDQAGSIIATRYDVRVPNLLVEGAGCGHDAAHIRACDGYGQTGDISGRQSLLPMRTASFETGAVSAGTPTVEQPAEFPPPPALSIAIC